MIPGVTSPAEEPVAAVEAGHDHATSSPLLDLFADPDADLVFILIGYPGDLVAAESAWPYALATEALMTLAEGDDAEPLVVYLADQRFATGASDDPPHTNFRPRLLTPYSYEVSLPLPGSGETRGRASFGLVEIANPDGALNDLLTASWPGRMLEIKVGGTLYRGRAGERTLALADFGTVFRGTVASVTWDDERIYLALRDRSELLDRPIQETLYAGTGGGEGGDDLKGRPKPLGFGVCLNVEPPMEDAANLVMRLHDGPINAVTEVRSKGMALDFEADYADLAALIGATLAGSEYATCLAEGRIRLGDDPDGSVTVDFEGDATGGYVASAANVARRIATWAHLSEDEVADGSVNNLHAANPAAVGVWTGTESVTAAELIDRVLASVEGWWYFDREGLLTVGRHVDPAGEPAVREVTDALIVEGEIERIETPEPVWQYRIGWGHNHRTQTADELPSLTAAERVPYRDAWRYEPASDTTARGIFRSARTVQVDALFVDQSDAGDEAARRLARDRTQRDGYRVTKVRDFFGHAPGQVDRLTFPRLGLAKNMVVTRLAEDAGARTTTLEYWG